MPNVNEMIQSKFLRKEDIEEDILVTLKGVELEPMPGDDGEQRWVLYFRELPKGLVLNTTTIRVLEQAFGKHTDQWIKQKVFLYVDPNVTYKGQVTGGLRVRPQRGKAVKAVLAALASSNPTPTEQPGLDDEIPH